MSDLPPHKPHDPTPLTGQVNARPTPTLNIHGGGPTGRDPVAEWHRIRAWIAVALAVAVITIGIPGLATRLSDLLWFQQIGYERVFLVKVAAQWTLGLSTGVVMFAILRPNVRAALRGVNFDEPPPVDQFKGGPIARTHFRVRFVELMAVPICWALSILLGLSAAADWSTLVQFFYRTPFGITDPVFGRDIAYYVFTVPVIDAVLSYGDTAVALATVIVVLIYLMSGDIGTRGQSFRIEPRAQWHLSGLAASFFAMLGLRTFFVTVPGVLQSVHGPLYGASYTDLHLRIPLLQIVAVVFIVVPMVTLWLGWRGQLTAAHMARAVVVVAGANFLLFAAPAVFQRLIVQPNELAREAPQIAHYIAATRQAWGIDSVERKDLSGEAQLTADVVASHAATISNVRLWDREPLLQTFGQLQAIRTYYDFINVDDDRYRVNGELRQVLLSARELNPEALPTRTFINEHLTFTHGMGLTMGPSNQVTPEGLPLLWVKDLPPASSIEVNVKRPQIYYGELANDFVLVPTRQKEFDYPAGEGDAAVYSTYAGAGGVPVSSFLRRLLFAVRFGSLNILLSRDFTPDTRVLFYRNVLERAQRALPFLQFDDDPYMVVAADGTLKWVLDAYTATDAYPYAQPIEDGTNYMRNSVKVVIDAYDGDIRAYLADPNDPMIRTMARIYPGMLRPLSELSPDLRAHLRYPDDLFRAQTVLYSTFHMTDPETFYHREDQWEIPTSTGTTQGDGFMRHIVMRLPGEAEPEFILMRPFTPRQKDNLAAWMVARNDGANYGKLVAYRFPRQSLVFGPTQIVNRINQDTDVSRQISLWDQHGSEVIRGELLVIPIEESLIYVQPLYLRAAGGKIPELKRVVVVHEGQVAMEETLDAGLARLFGPGVGAPATSASAASASAASTSAAPVTTATASPPTGTRTADQLLRDALDHYDRARAAQRNEDWATYGDEMRKLGDALRQIKPPR